MPNGRALSSWCVCVWHFLFGRGQVGRPRSRNGLGPGGKFEAGPREEMWASSEVRVSTCLK